HIFHFSHDAHNPLHLKINPTLCPIGLPHEVPPHDMPALEAISRQAETAPDAIPDLKDLAQILYYSAGVTKIKQYSGGDIMFRAAACTGALYEIELYLVCGDLPELEAGVYHFSPHDFSLRRLRRGGFLGGGVGGGAGGGGGGEGAGCAHLTGGKNTHRTEK